MLTDAMDVDEPACADGRLRPGFPGRDLGRRRDGREAPFERRWHDPERRLAAEPQAHRADLASPAVAIRCAAPASPRPLRRFPGHADQPNCPSSPARRAFSQLPGAFGAFCARSVQSVRPRLSRPSASPARFLGPAMGTYPLDATWSGRSEGTSPKARLSLMTDARSSPSRHGATSTLSFDRRTGRPVSESPRTVLAGFPSALLDPGFPDELGRLRPRPWPLPSDSLSHQPASALST